MTSWTSPRTWTAEILTSTLLNVHLRDNLLHLYEKVPTGMMGSADRAGVAGAGSSEEWDTATTGLTWSPSSPTTVDSNTTVPGHLYILNQADITERLGTKAWAPAGAFDARMGGAVLSSDASAAALVATFGLYIANNDNSNRAIINVRHTYNTGARDVLAYTYASSTYTQRGNTFAAPAGAPLYLRIARDGSNNISFYWSANGILWDFIATQALTFTVASIGVRVTGNATATFKALADWLRTSV